MQNNQNLPTIDEDALNGVSGGAGFAEAYQQGLQTAMKVRDIAVATPFKIAGVQISAFADVMKAVGDFLQGKSA
jgi:hypothetical protein